MLEHLRLIITLGLVALAAPCAKAASTMHLRSSKGSSIAIAAQKSMGDSTKQTIELTGDVKVIYDQQFISCDHAIIDRKNETILAEGNLVISSPTAYIEGDSALMSYRDDTGTIINGFVKSGPVIFEGHVVKKTGPQSFDSEDASFTACTTCPTAWTFSGSRIQAELGGYAYIKHAKLKIANIPALWLPYLIVPLKSERQSGILIPTIDYNVEGGTAFGDSFFWAISRSQDATITGKYYTQRKWKGLVDYRYSLSPGASGELYTGFIRDKVFAGKLKDWYNIDNPGSRINRNFITYKHDYDLPDGFNTKLKINYVSDLLYARDFPEEVLGLGDPALENRMTLTKNTERTHSSLDAAYYTNQLHDNVLDSNKESVHRFPEIRFDLVDRPVMDSGFLSNILFRFDADYANFARDDLAWDDAYFETTTTNGVTKTERKIDRARKASTDSAGNPIVERGQVFDPNSDIVRTGQRIDLKPALSAPFRIGSSIDVLPVVGLRHTQYSLNVAPPSGSNFDPSPYRQYVTASLSFRTRFSRVFGDNSPNAEAPHPSVTNWSDNESRVAGAAVSTTLQTPAHPDVFRHEIEPELVLDGVRDTHNTGDNAFLGPTAHTPSFLDSQPISDSDVRSRNGVQFDYEDRLTNRNTISTYLTNRLVKKSWLSDGNATYKQIASWKVGQSYDIDENNVTGRQRFLFSDISSLLDVRFDHFETNTLIRYFPYHGKTNTSSRARVMDSGGRFAEVNYVENYLITTNRDDALANHTQTIGVSTGFTSKYLEFNGGVDLTPNNLDNLNFGVKSWGALMNFKPPGNCWGIILTLRQDIGNSLEHHLSFDYNWGGEGPKVAAAE